MRKEEDKNKKTKVQKGSLPETRKDIPHGHGAHANEKESNAQEDYPGTTQADRTEEKKP
jgi:hypothetical protein